MPTIASPRTAMAAALLLCFSPAGTWAQASAPQAIAAPDTEDAAATAEIAAATTEPRFSSPWVSYLPASATVPSPRAFLHRIPGAPGELVDSATAYAYSRALAAASPRVRVFTIGRSEEGRDIVLLAIADEQGIRDLDRLKAATAALADPRKTDPAAAERIIAGARPIYYFNAALHSDETGSTETMLELAYRLAVSEQPMIRRIRENVVVLINPVSNPDGRDKQVEWFYRFLKGKTDRATLPRQSPPYWSRYTLVDINRDAIQLTHETTKAVQRMFFDWHPQVVHDLHESVALLITWNGTGPINEDIDPVSYDERLEMSFHEVTTLTGFGMPGVWSWNFGDDFAHLFLDSIGLNHNSMGRGYETFGNGTAETLEQMSYPDETSRDWYRPEPPPADPFRWSARDNVNYMETAALAALDMTAQQSKTLLQNFYQKGLDSWRKGTTEAPFAFLIPEDQGDPTRVAQLVALLMAQGIEVQRARTTISLKEGTFPAGTYVVRLDQPYRNYAVDLLAPKFFPKDAGEPYDDISWELPANYHLAGDCDRRPPRCATPRSRPSPQRRIRRAASPGRGRSTCSRTRARRACSRRAFGCRASSSRSPSSRSARTAATYPRGSWIFRAQPGLDAALVETAASALGLEFQRLAAAPARSRRMRHRCRGSACGCPGRIPTPSAGCATRSTSATFPTPTCATRTSGAGNLRSTISTCSSTGTSISSSPSRSRASPRPGGRWPFKKTKATPSLGTPAESDDITGGDRL